MRVRARIRLARRMARRLERRFVHAARAAAIRWLRVGRRVAIQSLLLATIAGLSLGAGAVGATLYGQFGYHPGRNADAWAIRPLQFVGPAGCAACHPDEATTVSGSHHAGVSCESCHGPLAGHPANPGSSPAPELLLISTTEQAAAPTGTATPVQATTTLCLTCHLAAVGRPTGFPAIDPATHYSGPDCVVCHDPHAAVAPHPPAVLHPLAGLPDCTVCHSPLGMRPLPADHPSWTGSCFACHHQVQS
jgi:hypothetical protein